MSPDDQTEWNKPRVVFLSHKEQFAIVALIRHVYEGDGKRIISLHADSPTLKAIYERLAPDAFSRMRDSLGKKKEDEP